MSNLPHSSTSEPVALHLLDSAQGHPVQTWRFQDRSTITIGRSESSDVVIADAHVSRTHVQLEWGDGVWTLISVGRHGTLVNDQPITKLELGRQTVFRLGTSGPMFRLESGAADESPMETINATQNDLIALLNINRERQQQEADDIAGNSLFKKLQQLVRKDKLDTPEKRETD